jgi:hypothetical protein
MHANRLDYAALCILLASAIAVGWPIWTGGYLTYMDNPVHIAEMYALASGEQWTDIGFCGFPLAYLHSPFWYGGLSRLLHMGIPAAPLFSGFLLFASLCPSVAIYLVGRRGLPPLAALVPAWLLLVQRTAVVGYGSVFGGMATYYIAVGLLIVFIDMVARSNRDWPQTRYIALSLALLALTHLYALLAAVLIAIIHSTRLLVFRPDGWKLVLKRNSIAYLLAGFCSSLYWYPAVRGLSVAALEPQNLGPKALLTRLLAPTDILTGVQTDLYLIDAIPLTALVIFGLLGLRRLSQWPNPTSLYGALLALALAVLLFVVLPLTQSNILGPNSWRFLFILRIGLTLAALPALLVLVHCKFPARKRVFATVGCLAVIASYGLGSPLRSQVGQPEGPAWENLQAMWAWLRINPQSSGRVFVQSTLMSEPRDHPLVRSHVLALTAHETGVRQLGAYYGVVPYKTHRITSGQFGQVLGLSLRGEYDRKELDRRLKLTNTRLLVLVDPGAADSLIETGVANMIKRIGRYTVLRVNAADSGWITADKAMVDVKEWSPGRVVFELQSPTFPTKVVIKQSYDPGWTVSPEATLSQSTDGLLEMTLVHQPEVDITLTWRPYRAQVWISGLGWIFLIILFLIGGPKPADGPKRRASQLARNKE